MLERVSLDIASGSLCTLVGPSGCGKTTLLRMLLSEERPSRGDIRIDDKPLASEPGPDRGVVFQRYSVFPNLTVRGNILIGLELAKAPVTGRLFGRARRAGVGGGRPLDRGGRPGPPRPMPIPLPCPAAGSSAWPLPRR